MLPDCSIKEEKDDRVHCVDSGERGVAHNHHHVDVLEINSLLQFFTSTVVLSQLKKWEEAETALCRC